MNRGLARGVLRSHLTSVQKYGGVLLAPRSSEVVGDRERVPSPLQL